MRENFSAATSHSWRRIYPLDTHLVWEFEGCKQGWTEAKKLFWCRLFVGTGEKAEQSAILETKHWKTWLLNEYSFSIPF